jgi:8-oxo-dGTP pyrophosphatase MutT (NUDIX family)
MNGRAVAQLEAWEEAGIVGPVDGPCGHIRIGSGNRERRISVYVQRVEHLRRDYPEDHQRRRLVVPLDELDEIPMLDAWKAVIRRLAKTPRRLS